LFLLVNSFKTHIFQHPQKKLPPLPDSQTTQRSRLQLTRRLDGDGANGAAVVAGAVSLALNLVDDRLALVVGNLAENDVLSVEMGGLDEGDEELRAVARASESAYSFPGQTTGRLQSVQAGSGH